MAEQVDLTKFITLGQQLYVLMNPQNVDVLSSAIRSFLTTLDECRLQRTRVAAEPLASIHRIPYGTNTGRVDATAADGIKAYMEPIFQTLCSEAGDRQVVLDDQGVVSQKLRDLPVTLSLNNTQRQLLQETISCIRSKAYRAGAVMGWKLAYDFIRQWVFDNHLTEFNAALASSAINTYSDFFSGRPGERTVIDTCCGTNIIGEKIRDNLRFYLRRRNDYAHPSFASPSQEQTNAYIDDLIDVMTGKPFA